MGKQEEYEDIMRRMTDRAADIKEAFGKAEEDVKTSQEIVREIADSIATRGFRELMSLRPNERVRKLFERLDKPQSR
jgi:hypothetical protein